MSRTTSSSITPAVPVIPVTPIQAITPSRVKRGKQTTDAINTVNTPAKSSPVTPTMTTKASTVKPQSPGGPVKKGKETAVEQATQRTQKEDTKATPEATPDEFAKGKRSSRKNTITAGTTPQRKPTRESKGGSKDDAPTPVTTPASTKRQHPGKLDITAAIRTPETEKSPAPSSQKADGRTRSARVLSTTTSVPASPATAISGSPIKRTMAPRTLRVVPTPKSEVPPSLPTPSASSVPHFPSVDKLRSRQASIASVNMPGTPISEMISDNASVTSTSISRASSPPPIGTKVGTAPVRSKTKSQAKKDRQERRRQIEEELAIDESKSDVEVVQAPIIGRKKKAKKSTPLITKPFSAAAKSQPASPTPTTVEEEHSDAPTPGSKPTQSTKTSARATPDRERYVSEPEAKRVQTPQSILADLQKTSDLLTSTLEFFKPLSSTLTHASRSAPASAVSSPPDLKVHFTEADLEALAKKQPVRLNGLEGKPDSRTLVTPNEKFFWGLNEEQEERALQLEEEIEEFMGYARFHPRTHSSYPYAHSLPTHSQSRDVLPAIATALKEAGKKLGNSNTQQMPKLDPSSNLLGSTALPLPPHQPQDPQQPPPPPQPQTPGDAGTYLNQYVLPKTDNPPPNQPRPEMAAVGGAPGSATANIAINSGKFTKAAKAVIEGGAVGSTEIDGMGIMAADSLGGVFVQGLEALVGAGLGFHPTQEYGLDANGNITLGYGGGGLDVQGLMNAFESTGGAGRYGRGSVMTMEEAERALHGARKDHDVLEKKLAALMKKNKKLWTGNGKA
jgi:CCR4-NOT transcription complex subunit 4